MAAACDAAGKQLMDGTMMMHNPRLAEIAPHLQQLQQVGRGLRRINAAFTFGGGGGGGMDEANIRLDPKLEPAGALGDVGACSRGGGGRRTSAVHCRRCS